MADGGDRIAQLLAEATAAREGRDRWRNVGPTLRALLDAGVPYSRITQTTGISRSTIHRLAGLRLRSSFTTDR